MEKVVLTGAQGGIGSVIEKLLREAGYEVLPIGRNDADLSNEGAIATLAKQILQKEGPIDWVVCSHGFIDQETELEKMLPKDIENTFRVNTLSIIYLAQQFLPQIKPGGGMVTISSAAGVNANGRLAPYSASKAAANSFMQALARNRPDKKFFAVAPGPTNTEMRNRIAGDAASQQAPEVVAHVVKDLLSATGDYTSGDIILVKSGETSVVSKI